MTPIIGSVPIAFVEGCCLGGSTEINSGFWHRLSPEMALRWATQYQINDFELHELDAHFQWAESQLSVGLAVPPLPRSSELIAEGSESMGWSSQQVPRVGGGLAGGSGRRGARQGMSLSLIPQAEGAGARVLTDCRVLLLVRSGRRVTSVLAERRHEDGSTGLIRIDADNIYVCAGPIQTPALLRRSGIKYRVGETLRVHPMLKMVALFPDEVNAQDDPLPLLQVKEFWPDTSLGGAFFTTAHASLILSENWPQWHKFMPHYRRMAAYYVGVRGTGRGSVRPAAFGKGRPAASYELTGVDLRHLAQGMATLAFCSRPAPARYSLLSGEWSRSGVTAMQSAGSTINCRVAPSTSRPCTPSPPARWAKTTTAAPSIPSGASGDSRTCSSTTPACCRTPRA
jgi:choline dehydrogenase-like flavoprotein